MGPLALQLLLELMGFQFLYSGQITAFSQAFKHIN